MVAAVAMTEAAAVAVAVTTEVVAAAVVAVATEAGETIADRGAVVMMARVVTMARVGTATGTTVRRAATTARAGAMTEADILADLFQLCGGDHPGRRDESEITFFKNGGGAHLDLMTARHLLARAEAEAAAS